MGKVIKKKLNGMSWWMKTSLILLLTLATSVFMYQGWYLPKQSEAAIAAAIAPSVVSFAGVPATKSVTVAAGSNRMLIAAISLTSAANTAVPTCSVTYGGLPMTAVPNTNTSATAGFAHTYMFYMLDTPSVMNAAAQNLVVTVAGTGSATYSSFWHAVYTGVQQIAPNGANFNNGTTTTGTSDAFTTPATGLNIGTGDTALKIVNLTRSASVTYRTISTWATGWAIVGAVQQGNATNGTSNYLGTSTTVNAADTSGDVTGSSVISTSGLVLHAYVADTIPPVAGTVTISPDISSSFTSTTPTITTNFTTQTNQLTSCEYTTNGGTNWIAGTTGGTAPNTTCTATPTLAQGSYNINMRATTPGGLGTATQIQRTVDTTVPNDPLLTVTSGDVSNGLSWTAATDTGGSNLASYVLVYATGATAPASCSVGTAVPGSAFAATKLFTRHTALTNGTQYSYRLCAKDGAGNLSAGTTGTATPAVVAGKIGNCQYCHFNATAVAANAGSYDGTGRNVPAGLFQGDHNKHANTYAYACTECHVDNSDFGHSTGNVNMANPLHNAGGAYLRGTSFATSNTFSGSTCSGVYCHSNGVSVSTGTITSITSPSWGTGTTNCGSCHGTLADNGRPNYTNSLVAPNKANTHGDGVNYGVTHKAQACTRCHNSVTGTPGAYVVVPALHNNGVYDVGAANVGYTYAVGGGTCNATGTGCHGAGVVTWGGQLGCIDCHNAVQTTSAATQLLNATVTSRPIITADFTLTQSHTRSRASKVATSEDCIVCHMEGDAITHLKSALHGNGYVELRDPDLGTTIKAMTHSGSTSAEGSYTSTANDAKFVRFKRNLGVTLESETAVVYTGVTNFQVLGGIMVNHCLKCHDSNGATSTTAQVTGGSAFKPFGATVAANGTNAGVLDVASQFASSNRSQHPVLVKNNNGYTNTSGTRLLAPWATAATTNAVGTVTKTGTTTVYGPLISCWDCHAPNGSTTATTLTSADVHGVTKTVATDAVELRGSVYLTSTTTSGNLCLNCHVVSGGTTLHGAGSAMQTASGLDAGMTYFQNSCYYCHSSVNSTAHAARPFGAGDAHGYNARGDSVSAPTAITTAGAGYAFIRRTGLTQVTGQVGASTYTATCGTGSGICSQGMGPYTPGGKF